MPNQPRILAFAGSARTESYNKKLIRIAADGARAAGAEVTLIDLADYRLPIFDQDEEAENGLPENALKLKDLFQANDGLLISSPEYNSSISPVLKNTIDWVSRRARPDEPMLRDYQGKVAVLMAASPGGLGGLRGLVHLRAILSNINVIVLPDQKAVSAAHEAFTDNGSLKDSELHDAVTKLGTRLSETLAKLKV